MITPSMPQSSLLNYESNDLLQKYFMRAWYISGSTCDQILELFQQFHQAKKTSNKDFSHTYHITDFCQHFPTNLCNAYLFDLSQVIKAYKDFFVWSRFSNLGPNGIAPEISIEYREPNTSDSPWQSERSMIQPTRNFFWITYLNDIYNGGETEFYYQKIKIKPRKGLTVMAPAEWTHTHRDLASDQGKHIVTGWLEHKFHHDDDLIYLDDILEKKRSRKYD